MIAERTTQSSVWIWVRLHRNFSPIRISIAILVNVIGFGPKLFVQKNLLVIEKGLSFSELRLKIIIGGNEWVVAFHPTASIRISPVITALAHLLLPLLLWILVGRHFHVREK